jgi:hypothetical protein
MCHQHPASRLVNGSIDQQAEVVMRVDTHPDTYFSRGRHVGQDAYGDELGCFYYQ